MAYKIGDVLINSKVVLAPMAGVTNIAYRKMCKQFGAGMVTTEMISDKGIFYNDKKKLPDANGRIWYEADFDYYGGYRNDCRILYSSDGLIFVTTDHYKTFYELM